MLQIDKPHIHRQVERWSREYGPYFRFRLGTRKIFVVADHAAIGTIFRDRPDGFRRTQRLSQIGRRWASRRASSAPRASRGGASARW